MEQPVNNITDLLNAHIAGNLSDKERRDLLEIMDNPEQLKHWNKQVVLLYEKTVVGTEAYDPGEVEDMIRVILKDHDGGTALSATASKSKVAQRIHRIHFLKTTWFRYAAAIIIILGAAFYLWVNNIPTNPNNQKNPLNPSSDNHDKAILTLANGQQIILNSTQGNIVKKGNLTVVNLVGKLKYEGIGTSSEYNIISTPKGGQYQIVLPDGSKVWLNAASSIRFPTAFTGSVRKVEMTGEAYMEIGKNAKQHFVVKTKEMEIEVLGTSFNVNAYEDEDAEHTTLVEGMVRIISNNHTGANSDKILNPGQQATINHSENAEPQKILIQTADMDKVLAWKNGLFNLKDASLPEVVRQLERWYDIQVKYEGEIPKIKFQGKLDRGVRLSSVISWFAELGVQSRLEGRTLIISQDKNR